PLEIFDVTGLQQTRRIVGWPSATGVRGIHVDLPAHPRGYQLLKDRRSSQQTLVTVIGPDWIGISLRSPRHQIFAVRMGPGHRRIEPAIRRSEVRGHKVV